MNGALLLLKALLELIGYLLLGQGVVYLLSAGGHERNGVYRFLRLLTSPFTRVVRRITPRVVLDKHVPLVTVLMVVWLWLTVLFANSALLSHGLG